MNKSLVLYYEYNKTSDCLEILAVYSDDLKTMQKSMSFSRDELLTMLGMNEENPLGLIKE